MNTSTILFLLACVSQFVVADKQGSVIVPVRPDASTSKDLENWSQRQYSYSLQAIERNLNAPGSAPGSVVAAPSHTAPDYWYHWVRDASLTMNLLQELYAQGEAQYKPYLVNYALFSRKLQQTPNRSPNVLGEPKFNMDGSAFTGDWGRPQNDGPALRALALGRFALILNAQNADTSFLYWPELPAKTVVKADLEFVTRAWQETSFDIWEEVRGHHFYTRLAQWRSLKEGAKVARKLNDNGAADYYEMMAGKLQTSLSDWWNDGFVTTTYGRDAGLDYKNSNIDVQVLLAALHSGTDEDPQGYGPTSDRILATTIKVINAFADLYTVNRNNRQLGTAIGRYPEDRYDGTGVTQGNPWFLATTAIAEIYYKVVATLSARGSVRFTPENVEFYKTSGNVQVGDSLNQGDLQFTKLLEALRREGDRYMERVKFHADANGNLHEQFNRDSGYQQGATQLTWSHVALCTAWRARLAVSPELL